MLGDFILESRFGRVLQKFELWIVPILDWKRDLLWEGVYETFMGPVGFLQAMEALGPNLGQVTACFLLPLKHPFGF